MKPIPYVEPSPGLSGNVVRMVSLASKNSEASVTSEGAVVTRFHQGTQSPSYNESDVCRPARLITLQTGTLVGCILLSFVFLNIYFFLLKNALSEGFRCLRYCNISVCYVSYTCYIRVFVSRH
jgi:hypothetical protein